MSLRFPRNVIYRLPKELSDYQKGLCSMNLVSSLVITAFLRWSNCSNTSVGVKCYKNDLQSLQRWKIEILRWIENHRTKAQGRLEVELHSELPSKQASRPDIFIPGGNRRTSSVRGSIGHRLGLEATEKKHFWLLMALGAESLSRRRDAIPTELTHLRFLFKK